MSIQRLPEVTSLWEILPKGTEGGKEFARIVDLLRFHEGRRTSKDVTIFSDVAGDFMGLDGFEKTGKRITGFQYKFFPSPLSNAHRSDVEEAILQHKESYRKSKLAKWVLITPQDLVESGTRKGGGDVTWFEGLKQKHKLPFAIEHWGHRHLQALFLDDPTLCLYFYPELAPNGPRARRTVQDLRQRYDTALEELYRDIQFLGVAVREQKSAQGVPMEDIYIPLDVLPEGIREDGARRKPFDLLLKGARAVVLGDPGSGKSTLLRFLALAGQSPALQTRYQAPPDDRLPILVILRRYAHELVARRTLPLRDYIAETIKADLSVPIEDSFLDYYLESGQAILLFDGMDELPDSTLRHDIRDRICTLLKPWCGTAQNT